MAVEFNEENGLNRPDFGAKTPKLAAFLIKKGWAKDESTANKIELVVAIVFLVLAAVIAFW